MAKPTYLANTVVVDTIINDLPVSIHEVSVTDWKHCSNRTKKGTPRNRFFLSVGFTVVGFYSTMNFYNETGEENHSFYIGTKQDMVNQLERLKTIWERYQAQKEIANDTSKSAFKRERANKAMMQQVQYFYNITCNTLV